MAQFLRLPLLVLGALGLMLSACDETSEKIVGTASGIEISDAHVRPPLGEGNTGAAYLTITNKSESNRQLIGVASPLAGRAEIHGMQEENGIVRMRQVPAIDILAGKTVEFTGHFHIMLFEINEAGKTAEKFPLTLIFDKSEEISFEAALAPVSANSPDH
jgi:copper(I)-binding protein